MAIQKKAIVQLTPQNSQINNAETWRQLQQAQTDWLMGDWEDLLAYDIETLQHHPERAQFAALMACAHQQKDQHNQAKTLAKQALQWGINPKTLAQILIANIHNTLAEVAKHQQDPTATETHYQHALRLTNIQPKLTDAITQARLKTQPQSLAQTSAALSDAQQKQHMLSLCQQHGYTNAKLEQPEPSYKGSTAGEKAKLTLKLNDKKGIANLLSKAVIDKLQHIQKSLTSIAPILTRIPFDQQQDIAVFEWIEGTLLWETSENRPDLTTLQTTLEQTLKQINLQGLIHGDIRPWNIIWNPENQQIYLIDWELSQIIEPTQNTQPNAHSLLRGHGQTELTEIDQRDLAKTIQVLQNPPYLYQAWWHTSNEFNWLPNAWK